MVKILHQGIIFLVSHHNLLCIFYMTAIHNIFCVAVFFHKVYRISFEIFIHRLKLLIKFEEENYSLYMRERVCGYTWGAFHQASCQCFSLTNLPSANQMQGFQ